MEKKNNQCVLTDFILVYQLQYKAIVIVMGPPIPKFNMKCCFLTCVWLQIIFPVKICYTFFKIRILFLTAFLWSSHKPNLKFKKDYSEGLCDLKNNKNFVRKLAWQTRKKTWNWTYKQWARIRKSHKVIYHTTLMCIYSTTLF